MTNFLRKHMCRFLAGTLTVSSVAMINAAAFDRPYGVLSSNIKSSVGNVLTAEDIVTAEMAINKVKAQEKAALKAELEQKEKEKADAQAAVQARVDSKMAEIDAEAQKVAAATKTAAQIKAAEEARARDAAEAKARDDAEAKAIAAQQATRQSYEQLGYAGYDGGSVSSVPKGNFNSGSGSSASSSDSADYDTPSTTPEIDVVRTVNYSSALLGNTDGTLLGNFKLTFYCPCEICNGRTDAKTASGTTMAEGRTIAVDKSIIPLGSRIYIDGFGEFIAEDTGSAIIGNRIDVCVSSHDRAYELGVQYGDVYLLD